MYDQDEGYTGANTHRPDYQRMLSDIEQGKINALVCYKLDRISRSVMHFAELMNLLDKHDVSFYSATEPFETDSNIGKAMMQIVMVFAEFERETIRERITDNMYALAKTERWVCGKAPVGYKLKRVDVGGKKQTELEINSETADRVKIIFTKYIEFRSMSKLDTYLLENHIYSQNDKDINPSQLALGYKKRPVQFAFCTGLFL